MQNFQKAYNHHETGFHKVDSLVRLSKELGHDALGDINLLLVPDEGQPDGLPAQGRAKTTSTDRELFLQKADAHDDSVDDLPETSSARRDEDSLALAAEDTSDAKAKKQEDITELPMFLVLLILSPDYFVIFAYLLLVW